MKAIVAHCIKSVRQVNTKYGPKCIAEVEVQGEPQKEFWMSLKQGDKLSDCFDQLQNNGGFSSKRGECHIVIDDSEGKERFVWCGMHFGTHSDLPWLEEKFGVTCESPYIGRQEAADFVEADPQLVDGE
jgi:hypothetical protein